MVRKTKDNRGKNKFAISKVSDTGYIYTSGCFVGLLLIVDCKYAVIITQRIQDLGSEKRAIFHNVACFAATSHCTSEIIVYKIAIIIFYNKLFQAKNISNPFSKKPRDMGCRREGV